MRERVKKRKERTMSRLVSLLEGLMHIKVTPHHTVSLTNLSLFYLEVMNFSYLISHFTYVTKVLFLIFLFVVSNN
jgi:hypothetical protein